MRSREVLEKRATVNNLNVNLYVHLENRPKAHLCCHANRYVQLFNQASKTRTKCKTPEGKFCLPGELSCASCAA
jgi:hypothetical protein